MLRIPGGCPAYEVLEQWFPTMPTRINVVRVATNREDCMSQRKKR